MSNREPGFDTAIHAGAQPDPATGARITPIYQTASFVFDDVDHAASLFGLQAFGNIYTRITNPTTAVLEERIAALEGGTAALAVSSGHAAQLLVMHALMQPGDEFVAAKKLYGGSINQFGQSFKSFDWHVKWAEGLAPADIVVESLTKFLGGHGNSMGGIIVDGGTFDWAKDDKFPILTQPREEYNGIVLAETFGNFAFAIACRVLGLRDLGPAISPFNAFQIITGIETLALRMERHCENALKVAEHLKAHDKVAWVSYAGLKDDENHANQQKYMPKGAGAVFTFGVKGGYEAGIAVVSNVEIFSHLANIGDTRSLVIHPASTTHKQLNDDQQAAAGAGADVLRLSIGIESVEDLIADLDQALAKV